MLRSSFLEGREPAPLRILAFRRRFIRFALLSPAAPRSQPGADDALFAWVAGTRSFLNAAAPGPSPKIHLEERVNNFCYDRPRGDDLPKIFWGTDRGLAVIGRWRQLEGMR